MKLYIISSILFGLVILAGCSKSNDQGSANSQKIESNDNEKNLTSENSKGPWSADGQSVLLKAKWIRGKSYVFRQTTNMEMELPIAGPEGSKTKMSMDFNVDVSDQKKSENKKMSVRFSKVKMEMSMAGQNMVYDSEDPEKQSALLKNAFGDFANQKFEAEFDKDDNFLSVDGNAKGAAPAAAGIGGLGNEEIGNMLKQLGDFGFPDTAVEPDAKWQHGQELSMQQMGKMKMTINYIYKGPKDHKGKKLAEIVFQGISDSDGEGVLVSFKDSKMSGTMLLDPELGTVVQSNSSVDMTMSVGGELGAEMDTKTSSSYSLISID